MRKYNIILYLDEDGKLCEDQSIKFSNKKEIHQFSEMKIGDVHFYKKGLKYYFGFYVEDIFDQGTENSWKDIVSGL